VPGEFALGVVGGQVFAGPVDRHAAPARAGAYLLLQDDDKSLRNLALPETESVGIQGEAPTMAEMASRPTSCPMARGEPRVGQPLEDLKGERQPRSVSPMAMPVRRKP